MSKIIGNKKWGVLIGIALVVFLVVYFGMSISYSNAWAKKDNLLAAQKKVIEANFDKMFKILKTQAGIASKYKDDFKDVYVGIMEGRYGTGGSGGGQSGKMMLWIKEHNPQFDSSVYTKLMVSVEANRQDFFEQQKYLISVQQQMKDLTTVQPASWWLGDNEVPAIKIISSSHTKNIVETGVEDDFELFDKKKG